MDEIKIIRHLIYKELVLEWRSKFAITGVLLYVVSSIFVALLSFVVIKDKLTWNSLFWVIMLFSAINAVAKSFMQESRGRQLYLATLASPQSLLIAKIIYNSVLMLVLSIIAMAIYSLFFGFLPQDKVLYFVAVVLGSLSFSTIFTLVSAISSKAGNGGILMAVLSFPLIIPVMIVLIRLAKNALDGLDRGVSFNEIVTLLIINVLAITFSLLLFPYLYRE